MATKKITELPLITRISGSQEYGGSVLPVVVGGTTNQISAENFSRFVNAYDAQTGSQNIFTQNQWFNATVSASTINVGTLGVGGNTTIAGTLGVTGNGTIGGNLAVAGRITAEEFYTEITTASVIYASGSTKFGDDTGDKHEFTGSINVSGSVIYNGVILTNIDANTIQRLQQATQSLQVATASLHAFTASQDVRNFTLSQITASFAGEIGGLEAYTASLKTAAIVSSSTQILNYNIFATTASNTFVGNQNITGSLSISAGEFNVITGSGNMTSSLIFDHTQNDGVTLKLRHNDRLSAADSTFNVNVWAAGVYTTFLRNGSTYSILNVEAFDDNKIYLYRDTRLYNKSLVIDNNLIVQQGVVIGSGSLLVNGVITGSILATNGVISSSNQLFELNQFTASQDSRNLTLSTVTGSLIGITNGLMAFTAALDSTYATDAQLYQLYQATRSIELTTGSLIGITNGLMAFTAALDNTYATDAQLYQLYQATRSLELHSGSMVGVTNALMAYTASLKGQAIVSSSTQIQNYDVFALNSNLFTATGSLIGITNGLMAFTAALDSTYATDAQLFQLYQATRSLELTTGSLIGITNGLMAFTSALDSTYATDAQLYQLYQATRSLELHTGSMVGITNDLMALTASMKAAAIVSSSTQIENYFLFALTSSANTFYGNQTISGSLRINGPLRGNTISGGLDVNGGITGSVRGNLAGVADYAATVAVSSVGTTTDTSLFPTFTTAPILASYASIYSHSSSSFFLNGVTRRVHMEGFVVSGSNNIAEISGSLNVTGSITINSGSIAMPNRPAFRVVGTASTDRVAQTTLSGSYASIDYNEGNYYNNSTGIFTAPLTGLYNVYFNGRCGSVNAQQQVIIYKNGATGTAQLMWEAPGNTGVAHFGVSGVFKLVAGDTLEAKVAVGSIQFDGNDTWGAAYIG